MPIVSKPLRKSPLRPLLPGAASLALLLAGSGLWAKGKKAVEPKAAPPAAAAPVEVIPVKAKDIYDLTAKLSGEAMRRRDPGNSAEAEARAFLAQRMFESKLLPPGGAAAVVPADAEAKPVPEAKPETKPDAKPAAKPDAPSADSEVGDSEGEDSQPAGGARIITPVSPQAAPYLQAVPTVMVRTRVLPGSVPAFKSTAGTVATRAAAGLNDVVLLPGEATANIAVRDAPVAFVGYGIVAPEFKWDDYAGIDVNGKVVVILDGEPGSDAKAFGGKAAVAHGRWPQKFATAAQKGAVGALIVVQGGDANAAGSPLSLLRARRGPNTDFVFDQDPSLPDTQPLKVRGFITAEVVRRVFESARMNFDDLAKQADARGFTGGTLKLSMSTQFTCTVQKTSAYNIVGVLPGSDPARAGEAIVYTAHWDGSSPLESAASVATLLGMARSAASRGALPRTQIFAAVAPQSEYFLGGRYLLAHLPQPAQKVIAHINLDGINPLSSDETVIQIGRGRSTIDALLDAAAKEQERKVLDDPQPELGLFYRSESLLFAKAGIPSVFLGFPDLKRYLQDDYRRKERFGATWSFVGAAQDGELLLSVGRRLAEAKAGPAGLPKPKKLDTL